MILSPNNIAVLGSTGSIGTSALEVITASGGKLCVAALAACSSTGLLLEQALRFRPRWVVVTDAEAAAHRDWSSLPRETEVLIGPEALQQVVQSPEVDTV